jgi:hypothetical protein
MDAQLGVPAPSGRQLGGDSAELHRLNVTPGVFTLRPWILQHLARYLPGAVGPADDDICLVTNASGYIVSPVLNEMESEGLIFGRRLEPGAPRRWELVLHSDTTI